MQRISFLIYEQWTVVDMSEGAQKAKGAMPGIEILRGKKKAEMSKSRDI